VFCNGIEYCDALEDCQPGRPLSCTDGDTCTIDSCDEEGKRCRHVERDFDEDGEVDWHCAGGTDCDDLDAKRNQAARERCSDGIDNDCDDRIDEDDCGAVAHDTCDDALDISAGGSFVVDLAGAGADYLVRCGELGVPDVTFELELEAPKDVSLRARGRLSDGSDEVTALSVRERCDALDTEVECARGFPGEARMRALPKGRYMVIAQSARATQLILSASFAEPTEAPENTTCELPRDVSEGGRIEGDLVDVGDDLELVCGYDSAGDVTYVVDLAEESDLELSAQSSTGAPLAVSVRTACADGASELRCIRGAPATGRLHRLAAGRYFVIVESAREISFTLDIDVLDPTDVPAGDGCAVAIDLPFETTVQGSFAGRQDLVDVLCRCSDTALKEPSVVECSLFLADTVYRLELDEPSDVELVVEGGRVRVYYDVREQCSDASSQAACGEGTPVETRVRNLPAGEHFVIVEAAEPTTFTLAVSKLPVTVPEPTSGNESCEGAFVVPETGGVYAGDTSEATDDHRAGCAGGARSNDVVFRLDLVSVRRVAARLEADFDGALYRHVDLPGLSLCESGNEAVCSDDAGASGVSLLDEILAPGTYYYVVDGFGEGNAGLFQLELSVEPP
jgi:hypothetical protein